MKDSLMAVGMTVLLFTAGYLVGKQQQAGRYFNTDDGSVFDTRTGVLYGLGIGSWKLDGSGQFKHDIVNGNHSHSAFKEVKEGYYTID